MEICNEEARIGLKDCFRKEPLTLFSDYNGILPPFDLNWKISTDVTLEKRSKSFSDDDGRNRGRNFGRNYRTKMILMNIFISYSFSRPLKSLIYALKNSCQMAHFPPHELNSVTQGEKEEESYLDFEEV